MFDYQQLETLVDIEREGSFENTAHLKRVSKSAISQKSKNIDHRIGFATVGRSPSHPTAFGKSLCRHIEKVRLLESSLILRYGDLFDATHFDRAILRVAFDDVLPSRFLLEHLEPKLERRSRYPFEMVIARRSNAIDYMVTQNVGAAISGLKVDSKHFVSHTLDPFTYVAVTSPDYAKSAFPNGFDASAVIVARSAAYDRSNDLNNRFVKQSFDIELGAPSFKISSFYGIRNLCVDGCAWAMLPTHLVRDHLQDGQLVDLHPGFSLKVQLYWHVSAFLDELVKDITETIGETAHRLANFA